MSYCNMATMRLRISSAASSLAASPPSLSRLSRFLTREALESKYRSTSLFALPPGGESDLLASNRSNADRARAATSAVGRIPPSPFPEDGIAERRRSFLAIFTVRDGSVCTCRYIIFTCARRSASPSINFVSAPSSNVDDGRSAFDSGKESVSVDTMPKSETRSEAAPCTSRESSERWTLRGKDANDRRRDTTRSAALRLSSSSAFPFAVSLSALTPASPSVNSPPLTEPLEPADRDEDALFTPEPLFPAAPSSAQRTNFSTRTGRACTSPSNSPALFCM
mmetsp:Transcript_44745/g.136527  ORF Transcript_44745/g.136527 Transcript_44745/m.136527 type:complete len:280 (+) Transcript_44745:351-1190(+)